MIQKPVKPIKVEPGFYSLPMLLDIFKGSLSFNRATYKVEMSKNFKLNMSDKLKDLLWGFNGFANPMGRYKNVHIVCNQLEYGESSINNINGETRPSKIISTFKVDAPIFGDRISINSVIRFDLRLAKGTNNYLSFSFLDCEGKTIKMNSAVELDLWLS